MADLQTNLNVPPYYDDYDENKQYYRILFRPGTAVQARELTQLQTMLQRQISRFGDSVYKDGTIIEGCNFSQYPTLDQVKFKDSNSSTIDFGLLTQNYAEDVANSSLLDTNSYSINNSYVLVSNTTGLRAVVFRAYQGAESAVNSGSYETNRAYVFYLNTGNNAGVEVKRFSTTSERVDVYDSTQSHNGPLVASKRLGSIFTLTSNSTVNALGVGYGIHVGPGVIYQKGYFLKSLPTNIVIKEESSNAAGIKVGFDTRETIIKPAADDSLYDNSTGSTNFSAPGAYRLKLTPVPVYYDSANTQIDIPASFLTILDFDGGNGRPVISKEYEPVLSKIGKIISDRTFEESGNYTVQPFQIDVSAHESNTQSFYYNVSPGIAYVDGQRVEFQSPKKIEVSRAITTGSANNGAITFNMGNYVKVRNLAGTFDIDNFQEVRFYSANQQVLSNNQSLSSPFGSPVGNANIRSITYYSGTRGTADAVYLAYLFNVRMNAGASFAANAKSIVVSGGTYGNVYADIVANTVDGKAEMWEQDKRSLVYPLGVTGVRRLTNGSGVNNSTVVYRKTIQQTLSQVAGSTTSSNVTFTMPSPDLSYFGPGTIATPNEDYVNITFNDDAFSANLVSGATIVNGSTFSDVTGTPAGWTSNAISVGMGVAITNGITTTYHTVNAITSSTVLNVVPASSLVSPVTVRQFWKKGTAVRLDGAANNVVVSSDRKSVTANFRIYPLTNSYTMNLQMPIARSTALPIPKVNREGTLVNIDCATNAGGNTGPWSLGFPDVYKVTNVFVGSSYSVSNPDRVDWFELDTGQTDNMYGLSKLRLKPQYNGVLTSVNQLVVKFNHFTSNASSSAALFFSEESYPVNDNSTDAQFIATAEIPVYTNDKGIIYDLRNCIDLRPYVVNTAIITTAVGSATINPSANSSTFVTAANSPISVDPDSNMTYNVEYFLSRRDIVFVNGDGSLSVKKGEPSLDPRLPAINKTGLKIAEVYVPAYPSLTFKEAE